MASNILSIPFRRTHSVSLSEGLQRYITDQYDQHPDMFRQDLAAIDRLRLEAVTTQEPHASGIQSISRYAAQLIWLGGKFPTEVGIEFSWTTALGFSTSSAVLNSSLRFELVNVLFNLAALYSQLAFNLNRTTLEGLKGASDYLCRAAGVLDYVKDDLVPTLEAAVPADMDGLTLDCLKQLMLAQAQECSWHVAVKNKYKDHTISRLAAQVSDYYEEAAAHATQTETVSVEWIHHMNAKIYHFAAAAHFRAACDCLEKRKYGEEVARLRESLAAVNLGLKESKWINRIVLGDLNALKGKVTEDLKTAEKDNDMIYLNPVPPRSELKKLERANLAIARKPKDISDPTTSLGERGSLGRPLFTQLVPYSVHVAASLYAERRDRTVSAYVLDELEVLNNNMRDILKSLNLPGSLEALEKPLGLPASVKMHADEVRQQGGLHKLARSIKEVEKLRNENTASFEEALSLLKAEGDEDTQARERFGTDRWTRPPSEQAASKLFERIQEINGYLKQSKASDDIIQQKTKAYRPTLKVMEGTTTDLENFVPSSRKTAMSTKVQAEATKLRTLLDDLERMQGRRRRKAQAIREKAQADDINPALLAETSRLEREFPMQKIEAAQFESLFEKRLEAYDEDRLMVNDERQEQKRLMSKLAQANAAFATARRGDVSATKDREQALQKLEDAYRQFNETVTNLDTARTFYNNLLRITGAYRDSCRDFRHQRRLEAGRIESELSNAMSALNLEKTTSLQEQKEKEALRGRYSTRNAGRQTEQAASGMSSGGGEASSATAPKGPAADGQGIPAPTPTRAPIQPPSPVTATWNPEMGIRFAPGASAQPAMSVNNKSQPTQSSTAGATAHNPPYPSTKSGRWSPGRGLRFN